MTGLDITVDRAKVTLGRLAERVGRLKTNGRLVSRSPLSDVLELEAMLVGVGVGVGVGVRGKAACTLLERADRQADVLERLRLAAATRVLAPTGAPV
ncbi:hypothetical protein ACFWNK_10185 [Streptomyces sp. NPDC058417]|uniref:hypothetical protein n=1 Tax=unclassified Streptomyces TaxID=2593676 RepID=UPI003651C213